MDARDRTRPLACTSAPTILMVLGQREDESLEQRAGTLLGVLQLR